MKRITIFLLIALIAPFAINAQDTKQFKYSLTLEQAIETARSQSPEAIRAKHTFRSSYWSFRSYKAEFLPSLTFSSSLPSFSKSMRTIDVPNSDGTSTQQIVSNFSNSVSGMLSIDQNVPFTGGRFSITSSAGMVDNYKSSLNNRISRQFETVPIRISYTQSIFGLNTLKWDRKIEPIKFEEAKRTYLKNMEAVALSTIRYFFDVASAQSNLAIAEFNFKNNEELYSISKGRYNMGQIGENDLLQSELNYMNASASVNDAKITLEQAKNRFRSFLGFNELTDIETLTPENVPSVTLDLEKVVALAKENNPDILSYQRQLIEAERSVAQQKANRGFQADLRLSYGLNQNGDNLADAYKSPLDAETASLSLAIPILDWGRGKGRVKMALSNQEVTKVQVEQNIVDFEIDLQFRVNQFNMQADQYRIATKADTIAQARYESSKQRYLIGKTTNTDMNIAQTDRDKARQSFVSTLRNYWSYYYTLRQLTLYDLIRDEPLTADYDALVD